MKQLQNQKSKYDWMISYQWTGIDESKRKKDLQLFINFFKDNHKVFFCSDQFKTYMEDNNMSVTENYKFCLEAQNKTQEMLFFIDSPIESKGMKLELDLARKLNQKRILLLNNTYKNLEWIKLFMDNFSHVLYFDEDLSRFDFKKLSVLL